MLHKSPDFVCSGSINPASQNMYFMKVTKRVDDNYSIQQQ
jgi:hypothetical protein